MTTTTIRRRRRAKRDRQCDLVINTAPKIQQTKKKKKKKQQSKQKNDPWDIVQTLLPSLLGLGVLGLILLGRSGFRGRATVAGIDLGTTNSVICVQSLTKSVGDIECIPDPATGSPIVPSVVSFLGEEEEEDHTKKNKNNTNVIVGREAKARIETNPHRTVYHAKRVIGRSKCHDAVKELEDEVQFQISSCDDDDDEEEKVQFLIPQDVANKKKKKKKTGSAGVPGAVAIHDSIPPSVFSMTPEQISSYIISHLMQMTWSHMGHSNIQSAVIAVPTKFDSKQRIATVQAFKDAGVKVMRVLEEPTAAALAYGLHRKENVHHIMVYDFGGGTLDVSVLHVSEGYVSVMGSDGDDRLGGVDFDGGIVDFLMKKRRGGAREALESVEAVLSRLSVLIDEQHDHDAQNSKRELNFMEEELAKECPQLKSKPLCTLSSLHTMAERMKINLSSLSATNNTSTQTNSVTEQCLGFPPKTKPSTTTTTTTTLLSNLCPQLQTYQMTLTISEYDQAVSDLYQRSLQPIRRLLSDLNLQKNEIDEVVMVGGTTRIPQIRSLVRDELGIDEDSLNTSIDPDLTVAVGAASVID